MSKLNQKDTCKDWIESKKHIYDSLEIKRWLMIASSHVTLVMSHVTPGTL